MGVVDQLTGLSAGGGQPHAVGHVVQAALQQDQHVDAGGALHLLGLVEVQTELLFQQAVGLAGLLLLPQLQAVLGNFFAAGAVLTGRHGTLGQGALTGKASVPLQKQFGALPSAHAAGGIRIFSH